MVICKYKFDKSIYSNLIPVFNDGYNGYTVSDEVDSENSNHIIRTIECDVLPTSLRFTEAKSDSTGSTGKESALIEVYEIDNTKLNTEVQMFHLCGNLVKISGLHSNVIHDSRYMLCGCSNLRIVEGIENWDTSKVTSMGYMFHACNKLTSLDVSNFDTSKVTDMNHMFSNCLNLTSLDVSFNTSNVTRMDYMFHSCTSLTSLDVSFNTSNVTRMDYMFYNCTNLTSLDVSNFDTSKVTAMNNMFYNCTNLTSLDVSNFDTSNVTRMEAMFQSCNKLTSLDVSNFNTSKVTNMSNMFNFCYLLENIDVSNWDTSNLQCVNGMFGRCKQMTMIDISNFDMSAINTSNVNNYFHMFVSIPNVKTLIFGNNKFSDDVDFIQLFGLNIEGVHLNSLEKVIVLEENTINKLTDVLPDRSSELSGVIVTNATISDEAMNTISSKNWSIRKMVAQYRYDANTYENLIPEFNAEFSSDKYEIHDSVSEIVIDNIEWESGDLGSTGTECAPSSSYPNIVRSKQIFKVIPGITYRIGIPSAHIILYDVNKAGLNNAGIYGTASDTLGEYYTIPNDVYYIRLKRGAGVHNNSIISVKLITRSIESVNGDLPTLMRFGYNGNDTENHEYDGQGMSLLKIIDMNTSELTTGHRMFKYCKRVESIKANWDTNKIVDMITMFSNCNNLTSLDVSNFDTSNVTSMRSIFRDCNSLTSLDVSNFNTSKVTDMAYMFQNCNNLISLDVSNFNTSNVTDMSYMFYKCNNLTSLDLSNWVTSKVTDMREMFYECNTLSQINQTNLVTSALLSTNRMFYGCNKLTSLDAGNWDTSNVADMGNMFLACYLLTELDVSNWNTSKVTRMDCMFYNCNKLTSLDVSNWDTKNVTNMQYMFYGCNNLTSLDVSNFNTKNVTNMSYMFDSCEKIQSLDVSKFNTSKVTTMYKMFHHCYSLTELDVSNWDTSNVNSLGLIFSGADSTKMKLTKIVGIESFNTSNVIDFSAVFNDCSYLTRLDLSKWNFSKGEYFGNMMEGALNLVTLDLSNFAVPEDAKGSLVQYFLTEASKLKYVRCNNLDAISFLINWLPTRTTNDMGIMLTNISLDTIPSDITNALTSKNWTVVSSDVLTKVAEYVYDSKIWNSMIPTFNNEFVEYFIDDVEDENGLVTRTISSMGGLPTSMIFGVKYPNPTGFKEKSLYNVNYMDISNLISANEMFRYCTNLMSINTANWDTSKITNMGNMFFNCSNLISLDVSNFDTSNVKNMGYMFCNCQKLISLDVSNFDTSNVTTMGYMFSYCKSLTSLDVSNFDTSNVTNMQNIFNNTPKLSDIGMLYCTPSTINTIASNLPTTHTQTVWVKDTKPNECTVVSSVEFKEYKDNSVMINLSSPLLKGDRIEVKDGKLCHYHKMGMVVLDGSEDWQLMNGKVDTISRFQNLYGLIAKGQNKILNCDKFYPHLDNVQSYNTDIITEAIKSLSSLGAINIFINKSRLSTQDANGLKQWLSENPTTVVYELAEPYYEDITPIQSDIVLGTYLECNMDIYTNLPIKTNLTYLTNITNTSSIEEEINAINEGTDLTNLLEDEINN